MISNLSISAPPKDTRNGSDRPDVCKLMLGCAKVARTKLQSKKRSLGVPFWEALVFNLILLCGGEKANFVQMVLQQFARCAHLIYSVRGQCLTQYRWLSVTWKRCWLSNHASTPGFVDARIQTWFLPISNHPLSQVLICCCSPFVRQWRKFVWKSKNLSCRNPVTSTQIALSTLRAPRSMLSTMKMMLFGWLIFWMSKQGVLFPKLGWLGPMKICLVSLSLHGVNVGWGMLRCLMTDGMSSSILPNSISDQTGFSGGRWVQMTCTRWFTWKEILFSWPGWGTFDWFALHAHWSSPGLLWHVFHCWNARLLADPSGERQSG